MNSIEIVEDSKFQPLGDGDDPEAGLFFFQAADDQDWDRIQAAKQTELATGMGFLVHEDGIIVTCAHVIIAHNYRPDAVPPNSRITVYGVSKSMPIAVDATILEVGWRGPMWSLLNQSYPVSPDWPNYLDERRDIYLEDFAFLRLEPSTARPHLLKDKDRLAHAGQELPVNPMETLLERARALPLGVPGYRKDRSPSLEAWCVGWTRAAIERHSGRARFLGLEPIQFSGMRLESGDIRPGFSGSPLWTRSGASWWAWSAQGFRKSCRTRSLPPMPVPC